MKSQIFKLLFLSIFLAIIFIITLIIYIPKNLVIVRPVGGIGNQLFQYAAAYTYSKKCGYPLVILINSKRKRFKKNLSNMDRQYSLHQFKIDANKIFYKDELKGRLLLKLFEDHYAIKLNILSQFLRKFNISFPIVRYVNDDNFFESYIPKTNELILLHDFFESEIFFKEFSDELKQLLKPKEVITSQSNLQMLVKPLMQIGSVCVHVRRGDISKNTSSHNPLPISYQKQAMHLIKQYIIKPKFFIFSDSIDEARKELGEREDIIYMSSNNLLPIEDLSLMTNCSNIIIANSTFSWWAAYLNSNPNKIVIAPIPRYNPEFFDACYGDPQQKENKKALYMNYAYPSSWIKLDYIAKRF